MEAENIVISLSHRIGDIWFPRFFGSLFTRVIRTDGNLIFRVLQPLAWGLRTSVGILTWLYINRNRIFTLNSVVCTNILDRNVFRPVGIAFIAGFDGDFTRARIDRHYDVIRRIIRS